LIVSITNIRKNAVHFAGAVQDHGNLENTNKDCPPMSINMTILLMLIVSFSIALAGVGQF
jgi:light-regulated signal transduction histidine kinase (bacteriophytochrome)